jgi:hypothetical protein
MELLIAQGRASGDGGWGRRAGKKVDIFRSRFGGKVKTRVTPADSVGHVEGYGEAVQKRWGIWKTR